MTLNEIKKKVLIYKVVIENFSFLSLLQFSNLLLFIIIIPYLFKTLGEQNYGLVVFAQSIVLYLNIIVSFGFNITATRDISISRDDPEKVSRIVSTVLILKILLFLCVLLLMASCVTLIPSFSQHSKLYFYSMLFCLSETLFPLWYFQGIEKMKYITFINVSAKVVYTIFAYILINNPEDYYKYPLIQGIGTLAGATSGLIIMFFFHKIRIIIPPFISIKNYFTGNIPIFISTLSSQIYVNANRIVLGAFTNMNVVAYYDVAERVVNIVKVPLFLIGQTLFPLISRERNVGFLKKVLKYTLLISLVVNLGLIGFANPIVTILSDSTNQISVNILRLLSFTVIPVTLSLFFAELLILPFGLKSAYTRLRVSSLALYLCLIIILIATGSITVIEVAIVILVVEIFVAGYSYLICSKHMLFQTQSSMK